ncbi:MAG: DUF1292 domain-containing protein [Lachnospiraceae bacterium]
MDKILFTDPITNDEIEFFCVEQTQINNQTYLLVTEDEDGDTEAYILKELSSEGDDILYEMVEQEDELELIGKVFAELLDEDIDLEY